ncbi:MAG: hypothetical protein IJV35_10780 [Neisseriaceae bacterium]|nr:hypothetical protein [Neisseriaceae bacterium]
MNFLNMSKNYHIFDRVFNAFCRCGELKTHPTAFRLPEMFFKNIDSNSYFIYNDRFY